MMKRTTVAGLVLLGSVSCYQIKSSEPISERAAVAAPKQEIYTPQKLREVLMNDSRLADCLVSKLLAFPEESINKGELRAQKLLFDQTLEISKTARFIAIGLGANAIADYVRLQLAQPQDQEQLERIVQLELTTMYVMGGLYITSNSLAYTRITDYLTSLPIEDQRKAYELCTTTR